MAKYSQAKRPMKVDTVLGEDALLLEGFEDLRDAGAAYPQHDRQELVRELQDVGLHPVHHLTHA